MKFSEKTNSQIEKINDYSQKPIKNVYEVSFIIENTFKENNFNLFKDLIFTAKYVKGLKSVLSNQTINKDDIMEKLFEEFNKNVQTFSGILLKSVESAGDDSKKYFTEKYFQLNHECLVNTMELIEDLTLCKEYFNNNPESLLEFK